MQSLLKYYQILGLSPSATLFEIKKSFREKAKLWHPDKCRDADAHDKFVQLTEAYEILCDYKEKGILKKPSFNRKKTSMEDEKRKNAEAKRKAEYASKMRYQAFIQSDYFKTNLYADVLIDHFLFLLGIFILFVVPAILISKMGPEGIIASAFVIAFTGYYVIKPVWNFRKLSLKNLWEAIKYLSQNKIFAGVFLFASNFIVFILILSRTMLPTSLLFSLMLLVPAITLTVCHYSKNKKNYAKRFLYAFHSVPFILSCVFFLNYFISFGEITETYNFDKTTHSFYTRKGGTDKFSTTISLENDQYDNYSFLRLFYGSTTVTGDRVSFKISRGIFGIRVVKGFTFFYRPRN